MKINRVCILDNTTNICINVLELPENQKWVDHHTFVAAPRNDGHVDWELKENGEWDTKEVPFSDEELAARARGRRDKYLKNEVDTMNPIRLLTMTQGKRDEWMKYRQDLLDLPQQPGFPHDIVWPQKPND